MQGKGVVKFFLVVMALVTLMQFFFIIPTRRVEKDADQYAKTASDFLEDALQKDSVFKSKKTAYLDSMSNEVVFKIPLLKSYTYQDLKSKQLALGLDLKGGMSVILQVDLREFIRALADDSKDPTFLEAIENATAAQASAQSDYVTLFGQAFSEIAGDKRLAPIFQRNEALRDKINYESSDAEVLRLIRSEAHGTVSNTYNLLKKRIDKMGVTQPNVSLDAERDLIIVELPGIDNPERARNFLQAAANLEFWNVFRINDPGIQAAFAKANELLAQELGRTEDIEPEILTIDTSYVTDSLGNPDITQIQSIDTTFSPVSNQGPLFDILSPNSSYGLAVMGTAEEKNRKKIDEYLAKDQIKNLFPKDIRFHWSRDAIKNPETNEMTTLFELYGIRMERNGQAPLSGELVTDAGTNTDPQTNQIAVSLQMNSEGAKIWKQMTTVAAQDNNREIAILLDDEVVSAPRVINPIDRGNSSISGSFSIQEAEDLSNILEIGKLPAKTTIIQESLVGPSLGAENIKSSMKALIIGFLLVLFFMIIYYSGGGIMAIIALLLNLFFIFGTLASYGTVLTLPGIAGIVLTIGMAVDANVIIFERIREEFRDGKGMLVAIADGFKHSYSAIIDANVTTILTAIVLAWFGLGPIKGFAVVLIIGVLCSLFTAVLVGRIVIDWWTSKKGRTIAFSNKWTEGAFSKVNIDWLGKRKIAYVVSGIVLLLGFSSFFIRGFDLGVDFRGGYSYNITFEQEEAVSAESLRDALTTSFGSAPVVKAVDTENTFNIVTDYLVNETEEVNGKKPADRVMEKLHEGVSAVAGSNLALAQFKMPDSKGTRVTSSSKVGPTIADDIQRSAFKAGIFALLLIFLYIFIRFSRWQYSLGAVAALFHDSIIVLAIFSMFHGILPFTMEIDQAFIAAILTVIGYSINDTVVVFDRIREYLNTYTQKGKTEVINMAVNSTISRTVITSLTTFFVVAMLFIFGGSSIKGFSFALLVGIIVGTYSSVFIATPIMADSTKELKATKDWKKRKSFSTAAQKAK